LSPLASSYASFSRKASSREASRDTEQIMRCPQDLRKEKEAPSPPTSCERKDLESVLVTQE
jgi:hypothetical protein